MNTTNRGSRQSEYQRSIAGAGNVRSGGDERYGGGSSGTSVSRSACPTRMGKSLINWERLMTTCANRGAGP